MKLTKYTILQYGKKVTMATNSQVVGYAIRYKDGNKLGLKKRTLHHKRLLDSKIVLGEKELKNIYNIKQVDSADEKAR